MRKSPKILIADGNTEANNSKIQAVGGQLGAERYANEICRMYPDAKIITIYPAAVSYTHLTLPTTPYV